MGTNGKWNRIAGSLKQVSVSGRHVWGVNKADHIWYRSGIKGKWKHIAGRLKQVAVSKYRVWGVNKADSIYTRNGVKGKWQTIGGKLKQVAVSGNHVWGVNRGDAIWYRKGVRGRWKQIGGRLKQIAVDGNNVWGVNKANSIYYRKGVTGGWKHIGGKLKHISVAGNRVWGVNSGNTVWYRTKATGGGTWKKVATGRMKTISSTYIGSKRKLKKKKGGKKKGKKRRKGKGKKPKKAKHKHCPKGFNYANSGYWANVYKGWAGKTNRKTNMGIKACANKCNGNSKCIAFFVWHPKKEKHCYLMTKTVSAIKGKGSGVACTKSIKAKTTRITKGKMKGKKKSAGIGPIKLAGNKKFCLNLHGFSKKNGGTINLWSCNRHQSQQWYATPKGMIKLSSDRKWCLNLHGYTKKNGAVVNLWKCNGHKSQLWHWTKDGVIKLKSDPRWCVNLHGYSKKNGGVVNLWKCNGHMSQKWKKPPAMPGKVPKKKKKGVPKDASAKGARKKGGALSKGCKGVCPDIRGLIKEMRMAEKLCHYLAPHRL